MCLTFSRPSKESDVSMGRNPVPVSRPVLWSCFSPICFQKTPKDLHGPFKKDRDTHSNLFGQHVDIGRTREETIALRDTLILLLQCLGMVINQKKSVMTPVQEIEFLGMIVNSKEITEKTTINKRDVSGFVSDRFVTVLELTKVSAHLTSTVLAILPAKLLCRFLQQQQIQALNLLLLEKAKCY